MHPPAVATKAINLLNRTTRIKASILSQILAHIFVQNIIYQNFMKLGITKGNLSDSSVTLDE